MSGLFIKIDSYLQLVETKDIFTVKSLNSIKQTIFIRAYHIDNSDEYIDIILINGDWYLLNTNQNYNIRFERDIDDFSNQDLNLGPNQDEEQKMSFFDPSRDFVSKTDQKRNERFIDFTLRHPDKSWNWYRISKNPNITMEDILINHGSGVGMGYQEIQILPWNLLILIQINHGIGNLYQ